MRNMMTIGLAAVLIVLVQIGAAQAWGAIAVDHDYGEDPMDSGYAFVTDHPTRAAAVADAMAVCRQDNENCLLVLAFQKCGAYAASKTKYGAGSGTSVQQAERRALTDCGGSDCVIVVSDCE